MKTACRRCGQCCESVALKVSPKDLREDYLSWIDDTKRTLNFSGIHLIYPMLEFLRYDKKIGRYRYRCKHLKKENGKAICTIYEIRPSMCTEYGQESLHTMGEIIPKNRRLYPKCVL